MLIKLGENTNNKIEAQTAFSVCNCDKLSCMWVGWDWGMYG